MAPRFLINEQKGEAIGSIGSSQDTLRPVRKNPKVHSINTHIMIHNETMVHVGNETT